MKISIIIPTYNRVDKLKEALESCMQQTLEPVEIIIGDNSDNNKTKEMIEHIIESNNVLYDIIYIKNPPNFGPFRNIDNLIKQAKGEYIALLHDDDLFESNALKSLSSGFAVSEDIIAVFGKYRIINEEGHINKEKTERLQKDCYRIDRYAGVYMGSIESAILQFPGNGFLIKSEAMKKIGYIEPGLAGDAFDYYFGLLLAQRIKGDFCFVNEFVARYRISDDALSRSKTLNNSFMAYKISLEISDEILNKPEIKQRMQELSKHAIREAAFLGHKLIGFKWFFGKHHRRNILSLNAMKNMYLLLTLPVNHSESV